MSLSDIAIARPVFTTMMSFAVLVVGLLAFGRLPTDLYPPVDFPILTVQVIYPGAAPEDIERDVTKPIEDAVAGIAGMDKLQSFTRDSVAFMVLQFEMGTNIDAATNAVRDRIGGLASELPAGAEPPILQQIDVGALPVMVVALASDGGVNETRELAEERLRPLLEQVGGVGAVNVIGGQDREIQVDLDLDRLAALGVSPTSVADRIGYENLSLPVGTFAEGPFEVGIRAEGQYTSVDDLAETVVHMTPDGKQVRLREVATIGDAWSAPTRYVRNNGRDAVSIEVVKRSGANTVSVAEGVRERLHELVPTLGKNASYEIISDQSRDIEANAEEVWTAIWFGGAMAVVVILFFLLDVRGTIISALALPTSVIGTFAAMHAMGFSINMMTLLGLSLAIGLLIDDAVVVRESITRRLEAGDSPAEAASRGTREIALAVLATTLSLVAVFVPVAFMGGIVGQFFKQFGLTIAVSVMLSLFVAFTLDPMLSARFAGAVHHGRRKGLAGVVERVLDGIDEAYRVTLEVVLRNQILTAVVAVGMLVAAGVVGALLPGEFVPKEDRGEILADLRLPVGSSLESTEAAATVAERRLMATPGIERVYTIVGHEDQDNRARLRVRVTDKRARVEPLEHFEAIIRDILDDTPQSTVTLSPPAIIEGLGDFPPMMLILQGQGSLGDLLTEAERVKTMLAAVPGASDVRLTVNEGRPELRIRVNRAVASDRGAPAGLIAATARFLVDGSIAGQLRDGGAEAAIRVRADRRLAADRAAIAALPIPSPRGMVSLGEVADIEMVAGASEINHFNRLRSVTITAQVGADGALGNIVDSFYASLAGAPLREGYLLTLDGQARDMKDTAEAMGLAVGVAAVFIFMVLASQFESLLHPFTLMISVPLALVGAVFALAITGNSVSMGSQIGIILLMGLVTKNAILLVDGALQGMRDGLSPPQAIRIAGPRRLRPILMTSAAMALGMIPTAIGTGIGAEFRAPMAIAVIGGVLSSTILTLYVVPVAFLWMERLRELGARLSSPRRVVVREAPVPVAHVAD